MAPPKYAVYEGANELTGHVSMRRSLFHATSELEDRTDKSLQGVRLSFASHKTRKHARCCSIPPLTRLARDVLWIVSGYRETTDRSGQPCRTARRQFLAPNTTKSSLEVEIRVQMVYKCRYLQSGGHYLLNMNRSFEDGS